VSPIAGEVEIRGTLEHPAESGDGIRGWIISSRQGVLKEWTVKHEKRQTSVDSLAVQPGETIDFVVDCQKSDDSDGFAWAPVIKTKQIAGASTGSVQLWHSANDFSGTRASATDCLGTIRSGPVDFQRICVCRLRWLTE